MGKWLGGSLSDYDFAFELKGKLGFDRDDGHAGATETSWVMAIRPDLVKVKGELSSPNMPRFEVVADLEKYFLTGVDLLALIALRMLRRPAAASEVAAIAGLYPCA